MNRSMLRKVTLPSDQFDRQFPCRLQNGELSIGIRNNDLDSRDVDRAPLHVSLGHQDVSGNTAHLLDTTNPANKKLRHYSRASIVRSHDDSVPKGLVDFVALNTLKHRLRLYSSNSLAHDYGAQHLVDRYGEQAVNPHSLLAPLTAADAPGALLLHASGAHLSAVLS